MTDARLARAARNNVVWCETVCRSHGRPGTYFDDIWINRQATPRFYPNAVTLRESGSAAQLMHIRELLAAGIPGDWGVKDSFRALDLITMGFRVLFDADWIWRSPTVSRPVADTTGLRWVRLKDAQALAEWERAWDGAPAPDRPRVFLPALLADMDVAVIGAYEQQRIVAGVIANRAAEVVGIGNIFVPPTDGERFWAACIAAVIDTFPAMPLVGYETGTDLDRVRMLGFEKTGAMRVWVRQVPDA
jgi:hypothetical protein